MVSLYLTNFCNRVSACSKSLIASISCMKVPRGKRLVSIIIRVMCLRPSPLLRCRHRAYCKAKSGELVQLLRLQASSTPRCQRRWLSRMSLRSFGSTSYLFSAVLRYLPSQGVPLDQNVFRESLRVEGTCQVLHALQDGSGKDTEPMLQFNELKVDSGPSHSGVTMFRGDSVSAS
jgi:hypothetical protein